MDYLIFSFYLLNPPSHEISKPGSALLSESIDDTAVDCDPCFFTTL